MFRLARKKSRQSLAAFDLSKKCSSVTLPPSSAKRRRRFGGPSCCAARVQEDVIQRVCDMSAEDEIEASETPFRAITAKEMCRPISPEGERC